MPHFNRSSTGKEVAEAFADHLKGKTVVITGPSVGSTGAETAISLAYAKLSQIILLGRTESKVVPVMQKIKKINDAVSLSFFYIDLASLTSVRKAAAELNRKVEKIDYLINNAGIMGIPEFKKSEDRIELQFASNHVRHFLLTILLLEDIIAAGRGASIVNVSSSGFELGEVSFDDWNFHDGEEYDLWKAYAQSKTGNVLFSAAPAEKLKSKGIQSYALHPGFVLESNLAAHVTPDMWESGIQLANEMSGGKVTEMEPPKTLQEVFHDFGSSGGYLQNCSIRTVEQNFAKGKENTDKLWGLSEKLVGQKFEL